MQFSCQHFWKPLATAFFLRLEESDWPKKEIALKDRRKNCCQGNSQIKGARARSESNMRKYLWQVPSLVHKDKGSEEKPHSDLQDSITTAITIKIMLTSRHWFLSLICLLGLTSILQVWICNAIY